MPSCYGFGLPLATGSVVAGTVQCEPCAGRTNLTLPIGVNSVGDRAFFACSDLTSVSLPDSITSVGAEAFAVNSRLALLHLPASLTSIDDSAFKLCTRLTAVRIPDNVTTIGETAFQQCSSLSSLHLPSGLIVIGPRAFLGCTALSTVSLPAGVEVIGDGAFHGSGLTFATVPSSVTRVGPRAFQQCGRLRTVTFAAPQGELVIGTAAFARCFALETVHLPAGITEIAAQAFQFCAELNDVAIPNSVTRIRELAFHFCISLTNINISISVATIELGAFQDIGCPSNTSFVPGATVCNCTPCGQTPPPTLAPTIIPTALSTSLPTTMPSTAPTLVPTFQPALPSTTTTAPPPRRPTGGLAAPTDTGFTTHAPSSTTEPSHSPSRESTVPTFVSLPTAPTLSPSAAAPSAPGTSGDGGNDDGGGSTNVSTALIIVAVLVVGMVLALVGTLLRSYRRKSASAPRRLAEFPQTATTTMFINPIHTGSPAFANGEGHEVAVEGGVRKTSLSSASDVAGALESKADVGLPTDLATMSVSQATYAVCTSPPQAQDYAVFKSLGSTGGSTSASEVVAHDNYALFLSSGSKLSKCEAHYDEPAVRAVACAQPPLESVEPRYIPDSAVGGDYATPHPAAVDYAEPTTALSHV